MSYARFGDDSDVYVYVSDRGLECCWCTLQPKSETFRSNAAMIVHLEEHQASGHVVPERVFVRLRDPKDVARNEAIWQEAALRDDQ